MGERNFEERQARISPKTDGLSLKGDFEQRRTGCGGGGGVKRNIKRLASGAEMHIALKLNAQSGYQRKRDGPTKTQRPTPKGKSKGKKANGE